MPGLAVLAYFWAKRIPLPIRKTITASPQTSSRVSGPRLHRKFTGRLLVRLDSKASIISMVRLAKTKGLQLASMSGDNADALLSQVLQQHDGIIFEKLRVALINEAGAARVVQLQEAQNSPFLSSEPERYVRAFAVSGESGTSCGSGSSGGSRASGGSGSSGGSGASGAGGTGGKGKGKGSVFKDTSAATWGIHAVNAMGVKQTGKGVKLAILDTGFDFTHPDFSGRSIHRKSFVGTRQAQDKEGHGTHIAGIAGGDRRGRDGARYGVANGARLYIGKILDDAGEGTDGQTLAGIEWALEKGCQIISMSFGAPVAEGEPWSEVFEQVARIAMANQCLLIAAAGNESDRGGKKRKIAAVNHPAYCPGIMAVGALTPGLEIADYSCAGVVSGAAGVLGAVRGYAASGAMGGSGAAGGRFGQVDIAAPGDNILSAKNGGGYRRESGTSMATAFVAGVAALLWERDPSLTAGEIWARLVQQAWRVDLPASDAGAGLCAVRN